MGLDPLLRVREQLERVVVDDAQVGGHDLLAGRPRLQADVDVVAVAPRLIRSSKLRLRTAQGESTITQPSIASTSPVPA